MKKLFFLVLFMGLIQNLAFAQPQKIDRKFTDDEAVAVILSYAGDEGEKEMLSIACAMRNRTTLNGLRRSIVEDTKHLPEDIKEKARKVWLDSEASEDVVNGGNGWISHSINGNYIRPNTMPPPEYHEYMEPTATIGRRAFYKVQE